MARYRYYSTQRPLGPGTHPRQDGTENVVNFFAGKVFCEEIGREAWGYIEYTEPLTEKESRDYELTPAGAGPATGRVIEGFERLDCSGQPVAFINIKEKAK